MPVAPVALGLEQHRGQLGRGFALISCRQTTSGRSRAMQSESPARFERGCPLTFQVAILIELRFTGSRPRFVGVTFWRMAAVTRRDFIATTAADGNRLGGEPLLPQAGARALGLDNFSVRAMGWKAPQLVDYAAVLGCDSPFITDLDAFESLEDGALEAIRQQAAAKHLRIQLRHVEASTQRSKAFRPKWGSAEERRGTGAASRPGRWDRRSSGSYSGHSTRIGSPTAASPQGASSRSSRLFPSPEDSGRWMPV